MTPTVPSPEGLRYDYEQTLLSLATLEAKYGLSRKEIAAFRVAESWTARASNMPALRAYRLASAVNRLEFKSTLADGRLPTGESSATIKKPSGRLPSGDASATTENPSGQSPQGELPSTIKDPGKPKRTPSNTGGSLKHRKTLIVRLYDVFDAKVAEIEERLATHARLPRPDNESEVRLFGQLIKYFESLTDLSDAELTSARASTSDTSRDDAERLRQNLVARIEKLRPPPDHQPAVSTLPD